MLKLGKVPEISLIIIVLLDSMVALANGYAIIVGKRDR
jgi:hypothetical protein